MRSKKKTKAPKNWPPKDRMSNSIVDPMYGNIPDLKGDPTLAGDWFTAELGHWLWGDMSDASLLALKKQVTKETLEVIKAEWAEMRGGHYDTTDTDDPWRKTRPQGPFWRPQK